MVSAMLQNTSRLSVARGHAAVASVVVTGAESKTGIISKRRKMIISKGGKKVIGVVIKVERARLVVNTSITD